MFMSATYLLVEYCCVCLSTVLLHSFNRIVRHAKVGPLIIIYFLIRKVLAQAAMERGKAEAVAAMEASRIEKEAEEVSNYR